MKTGKKSRVGGFFRRTFNFRYWADFDRTKSITGYILEVIKNFILPKSNKNVESFESAVSRWNLTEKELENRQKGLMRLAIIMLVLAFSLVCYAIYHIFYGSLYAMGVSIVLALLALMLAFRYHFWQFQIRQRKLGCTIQEWYEVGIKGGKK